MAQKIIRALFVAGMAVSLCLALVLLCANRIDAGLNDNELFDFNEGWYYINEAGGKEYIKLPQSRPSENPVSTIHHAINTDKFDDRALCFRSSQQNVRVFIDGEEIYSFGFERQPLNISTGSGWNLVRLPGNLNGKTISVELTANYPQFNGVISNMAIGTKICLFYTLCSYYLPDFLISGLIIMTGAISCAAYLLLRRERQWNEALYLGLFALLIGGWMMTESRLLQTFIADQLFLSAAPFIFLALLPIPLTKYLERIGAGKYNKYFDLMRCGFYLNFLAITALQVSGGADFYETVAATHVLIGLLCAGVIIIMIREYIVHRSRELTVLFVALSALIASLIPEFALFYIQKLYVTGRCVRVGTLLFVGILGYDAVKKLYISSRDAQKLEYFKKLASTDVMTGCLNRTQYINDIDELAASGEDKVGFIMVDENRLKHINDQYGHQTGDDALTRLSRVLRALMHGTGKCYRTGGDEFLCVIPNATEELMRGLKDKIALAVEAENAQTGYELSASIGYSIYDRKSGGIEDAVREADDRMYRMKSMLDT